MMNKRQKGPGRKTVEDVYLAAMEALREEMEKLKKAPLTDREKEKISQLAKGLSAGVLQDMGIL